MGSVEQWWGLYAHLARPADLPPLSDLHLFKLGIKPMWEDPANVNGGKWVSKIKEHHPCIPKGGEAAVAWCQYIF